MRIQFHAQVLVTVFTCVSVHRTGGGLLVSANDVGAVNTPYGSGRINRASHTTAHHGPPRGLNTWDSFRYWASEENLLVCWKDLVYMRWRQWVVICSGLLSRLRCHGEVYITVVRQLDNDRAFWTGKCPHHEIEWHGEQQLEVPGCWRRLVSVQQQFRSKRWQQMYVMLLQGCILIGISFAAQQMFSSA